MKRLITITAIVCALCVCLPVQAQDYETRHEIGISTGILSNSTWVSFLEDFAAATISAGHVSYGEQKFTGPISAEYFYHVSPLIGVGAIGSFTTQKRDINVDNTKSGEAKYNYFTVLPAVKIDWFRSKNFGAYSKLGLGATLRTEKYDYNSSEDKSDTSVMFNWQASLIGIEAGVPNFRAFLEAGFGEQGVLVAGLRCRF